MTDGMTIGRVAKAADCNIQTIRYYEQIGLIPAPRRSSGNQRLYDGSAVRRLAFIRHARELGFPLSAIRDLISLVDQPGQSCEAADRIATAQLHAVEGRIRRLTALRGELERMVKECQGGRVADCRVIEVLSDHGLCETPDHGAPALAE